MKRNWSRKNRTKCLNCGDNMSRGVSTDICFDCRQIKVEFTCDYCDEKGEKYPSEYYKHNKHFCDYECMGEYQASFLVGEKARRFGTGQSKEDLEKKIRARTKLNHAVRDGRLQRKNCELCDKIGEAHHEDYSKALEVRWFCRNHHRDQHAKQAKSAANKVKKLLLSLHE